MIASTVISAETNGKVLQAVDVPAMKARIAELEGELGGLQVHFEKLGRDHEKISQAGFESRRLAEQLQADLRTTCKEASERELNDLQKINALKAERDRVIAGCQELINGNPPGAKFWNKNRTRLELLRKYLGAVKSKINKPA